MDHFPIFMAVSGRRIVVSGGGEAAVAKLRLILKTTAHVTVFASDVHDDIRVWADAGRLKIVPRQMEPGDAMCAVLFYAANEDAVEDARVSALAQADGAKTNIVDDLGHSQFITPAMVDRDPVVVAIGTEGAAPVLARKIKADVEAMLPASLGTLARIGKRFRRAVEVLPMGRKRRDFWSSFYFKHGPQAITIDGEDGVIPALETLLDKSIMSQSEPGHVALVGAGPGDPDLLTMKARKALDTADVVIHDRLVSPEILELARREAVIIDAGKTGFGASMPQNEINALMVQHALAGAQVVRLKSGDPAVFGRLDEELDALVTARIAYTIVPGITAASAAVASIGQSLTRRGRNSAVRLITGHDTKGYAGHDWQALAKPGEVAAIYMGKRAAHYIQGRLLMHGANPATPVTIIENASRIDQRVIATTLAELEPTMSQAKLRGPAVTILGLAPRAGLALNFAEKEAI